MNNNIIKNLFSGTNRIEILKDVFALGIARYISLFIGMIRGFIVPKLLDPTAYGIWKGLSIITEFSRLPQLGTTSSLFRQIPMLSSKEREVERKATINTAWTVNILNGILISIIVFTISLFITESRVALAMRLFTLLIILNDMYMFFKIYYLSAREIKKISIINVINAAMSLVVITLLTLKFGLNGLIIASIFALAITNILFIRYLKVKPSFKLHKDIWLNLIKIGFPIMISGLLLQLVTSIDKIVVLKFLGKEQLGYYALGITLINLLNQGFLSISSVISPRLIEKFSKRKNIEDIRNYLEFPIIISNYLSPVIYGCFFYCSGIIYEYFLPKYVEGQKPFQFLLLAGIYLLSTNSLIGFFIALKRQLNVVVIQCIIVLIAFLTDYMAIKLYGGIEHIAIATIIVMFLYSLILLTYSLSFYFQYQIVNYFKYYLKIYFPSIYCVAIICLIKQFGYLLPEINLFLDSFFLIILFVGCYSPILYTGYKLLTYKRI